MQIAILNTGNELLRGATLNTNLTFSGAMLATIGEEADCALAVPDEPLIIRRALASLLKTHELVIVTGGLGPTADDLTRDIVCGLLNIQQHEAPELRAKLEKYWLERHPGSSGPPSYYAQALVPEYAQVMNNCNGTAPGLWIDGTYFKRNVVVALLPGPPSEFEPMFRDEFLPRLSARRGKQIFTEKFMASNTSEMAAQEKIEAVLPPHLRAAYCASVEGTRVFLTGDNSAAVHEFTENVKKTFGNSILANGHQDLVDELVERLAAKSYTVATAESCTGGMIGAMITAPPGASNIYPGGVVCYSNESKQRELNVSSEILEQYGAVSRECATAMVEGVCQRFGTQAGISVTGIAGPSGGTPQKPVGLVYVGVMLNGKTAVLELHLRGDRAQVRRRAAAQALILLREMLMSDLTAP